MFDIGFSIPSKLPSAAVSWSGQCGLVVIDCTTVYCTPNMVVSTCSVSLFSSFYFTQFLCHQLNTNGMKGFCCFLKRLLISWCKDISKVLSIKAILRTGLMKVIKEGGSQKRMADILFITPSLTNKLYRT